MNVYAQQGYGKGDKIHQGLENNYLDGIILSPRDEKKEKMEAFIKEVQLKYPETDILFDPQFYYSMYIDGTSKNLDNCTYYPGVIKLSDLRSFKNVSEYARKTIEHQENLGLNTVVSPNILIPNFGDRQAQIALNLAEESANIASEKGLKIFISLIFSESALNESRNVNDYLNELTTLDVEGFYITIDRKNTDYNQKFDSETTLLNLLTFIYSLSEINEYKVIMGYSDILGVLYTAVGAQGFATGWYNSSRKFTVQQRILPSNGGRMPRERYTSIPLLNSILISELDSIAKQYKNNSLDLNILLSNSIYEHIVQAGSNPSETWSRGISHLQHWSALKNATNDIFTNPDDISDRLDDLEKHIATAIGHYKLLENLPLQLERASNGDHLITWQKVLESFRKLHNV